MKKILFGLIATVFFGLSANASELYPSKISDSNPSSNIKENIKVRINVDVTWGRKSRDCKGFGICDVDFTIDIENRASGFAATNNNGVFILEFSEDGLKTISEHFKSNTILTIEEDYVLSDKVCKALELKSGYTIKTGKYKIQKAIDGAYSVSF